MSMDIYVAQIEWIPPEQGGRKTLPLENAYYPIIITEKNKFDPHNECWSIIVRNVKTIDTFRTISKIQYFSEKAPNNLFPGIKFMMYEGYRLVANGIVLEKIVEEEIL